MGILTLDNVSYVYMNRYQTVQALKDVSYSFEQGKVYAVMGKSGSGKTTMLSLLAGLDLPSKGQVIFQDTATSKMNRDKYRRKDVSVIYQAYNLFPLLTALENVMYPLELKGIKGKEAKVKAAEMIKSVGLTEEVFNRFPAMLSGGEQQRVAIARAIVSQPKVILADEPTGNLDTDNGENIVRLLKGLAKERNCCVIIVTHDPTVAAHADVVLRMQDGEFVQEEDNRAVSS
jgi:putative ABC transport system ATP-binding protein